MRASYFLWGILVVCGGVSLFMLKYKVQALENELVARQEQVLKDRAAIRVLQAEWTYLNDPERLRRLSAEHLGFVPATPKNIADISALPYRDGTSAPASSQAPSASVLPRPEIEAKVRPVSAEPSSFGPVLLARIQQLLLSTSAGATTYPAKKGARP